MQNLLELKGISHAVSDRFSLRDVTLAVEPGQIIGFVVVPTVLAKQRRFELLSGL